MTDAEPGRDLPGPLLRIDGLRVAYGSRGAQRQVLSDVALTVARGETVALVGESGSGKSTLAHAIIGLLPSGGSVTGGEIVFGGERLDRMSSRALQRIRGAGIGLVPQDPGTSLNPVQRIGDQIAEVLRIHGRANRRSAAHEAIRILTETGMDRPEVRARQYPGDLSGGQRQRVLIGIALACAPQLVIADEPTSALDVTVQRRILDHLSRRTADLGTAVLLITHDLAVAADRADRIVVMRDGRIVETGSATEILENPRHEYTRALIAAAPSLDGTVRPPRPRAPEPLLSATGLHKTFRIGRGATLQAVDDVSVSVDRGETLALVGESGSGKSTTARILAQLAAPDTGVVRFGGADITRIRGARLRALRRRIQIVHQNPYAALDPKLTVGSIIAEPLQAFGIGDRGDRGHRVGELLEQVALAPDLRRRRPGQLSGGQRQRVAIARALAVRPELLVLDEPVSALDVSVQGQILDLLERLQSELDLGYLVISHDLAVVRRISDRIAVMRDGRIVETGSTADIFATPEHEYTRTLLAAIPGTATGAGLVGRTA